MDTDTTADAGPRPLGRPMSFDRAAVVTLAMDMFWQRGYHDVSLNEIAKAAGLTRASLYNTFGSKEALFLEAVRQYWCTSPDASLAEVPPGVPVATALRTLFQAAGHTLASDAQRRGCLAINSANELLASGGELGDTVRAHFERRRGVMQSLVARAVQGHELPGDTDVTLTANLILTFQNGLSVFSKSGASEASLQQMGEAFLRQLGFGAVRAPKPTKSAKSAKTAKARKAAKAAKAAKTARAG